MWQLFLLFLCALGTAYPQKLTITVNISEQKLYLINSDKLMKQYTISTSGRGIGDEPGSYKTPLGKHRIHKKIGAGAPLGTIFKTGINTKKRAPISTQSVPGIQQQDLITTRIFQLEGLEKQNHHSFSRGIWIHGTPYEGDIGTPCSHGCVRMRNKDICELYDLVSPGIIVDIIAHS